MINRYAKEKWILGFTRTITGQIRLVHGRGPDGRLHSPGRLHSDVLRYAQANRLGIVDPQVTWNVIEQPVSGEISREIVVEDADTDRRREIVYLITIMIEVERGQQC